MRRRLLWSTLAAAALAVVLLGVPLAALAQRLIAGQVAETTRREAAQVAAILDRQAGSVSEAAVLLTLIAEATGARLTLLTLDGAVVHDAGDVAGREIAVSLPVRLQGVDLVLRVARSDVGFRHQTRRALLAIGALALLALGGAAALAVGQGRRLAAPMEALATAAQRLGDGDFSVRAPRSGLPEPDQVAEALERTATRLALMLERSRSFSADASHQLRTPLTALRLDLETLEAAVAERPREREFVRAAIAEADRLEATVEELLALARPPGAQEGVDLVALVTQRLDAWCSLARARGREVRLDADPVPPVYVRAAAVGQALQVLLDNALEHGDGTVTVSLRLTERPAGATWVRLCVADEGPGLGSAEAEHSGRGLSLARALIEAEGGRLHIERPGPHPVVCLLGPCGLDDRPQ